MLGDDLDGPFQPTELVSRSANLSEGALPDRGVKQSVVTVNFPRFFLAEVREGDLKVHGFKSFFRNKFSGKRVNFTSQTPSLFYIRGVFRGKTDRIVGHIELNDPRSRLRLLREATQAISHFLLN